MFSARAIFSTPNFNQDAMLAINYLVEQWRFNGQIIGRELALFPEKDSLVLNVITPEMDSLLGEFDSIEVRNALAELLKVGVTFESVEVNGVDFNSDNTSEHVKPAYQILYTTYLESCSPLKSGVDFGAIPLYTLNNQTLSRKIIKWQEDWQACDQLQMNGTTLEQVALAEISAVQSELAQQGRELCTEIERITGVPTYYYLYRLGTDRAVEEHRTCPVCKKAWKLPEPLFELFHFKCDKDRIVSNLSWELD